MRGSFPFLRFNKTAYAHVLKVPISPFDNALAIDQMEVAYSTLLQRDVARTDAEVMVGSTRPFAKDNKEHPKIITYVAFLHSLRSIAYRSTSLGGDHTVVLPILRSLYRVYGPVSVIHFDAHLDTWHSQRPTAQARITHGSFFYIAHEEGLLSNMSVHAGIRCKMSVRPCLIAGGLRVTQP